MPDDERQDSETLMDIRQRNLLIAFAALLLLVLPLASYLIAVIIGRGQG